MNLFAAGIDYFIKGGWVMWPLLVCSIAAMAIGVERTLYFRKADGDSPRSSVHISKKTTGIQPNIWRIPPGEKLPNWPPLSWQPWKL